MSQTQILARPSMFVRVDAKWKAPPVETEAGTLAALASPRRLLQITDSQAGDRAHWYMKDWR